MLFLLVLMEQEMLALRQKKLLLLQDRNNLYGRPCRWWHLLWYSVRSQLQPAAAPAAIGVNEQQMQQKHPACSLYKRQQTVPCLLPHSQGLMLAVRQGSYYVCCWLGCCCCCCCSCRRDSRGCCSCCSFLRRCCHWGRCCSC